LDQTKRSDPGLVALACHSWRLSNQATYQYRPSHDVVRAIQEPSPAINGGGLRCQFDESGRCLEVHPCYGDYRTPASDDCLTAIEQRAWSSPIYLDPVEGRD
jgi:hypothetical protein